MSDTNLTKAEIVTILAQVCASRQNHKPLKQEVEEALEGYEFTFDENSDSVSIYLTAHSVLTIALLMNGLRIGQFVMLRLSECKVSLEIHYDSTNINIVFPHNVPAFNIKSLQPLIQELKEISEEIDLNVKMRKRNANSGKILETLVNEKLETLNITGIEVEYIDGSDSEVQIYKALTACTTLKVAANLANYQESIASFERALRLVPYKFFEDKLFKNERILISLRENDENEDDDSLLVTEKVGAETDLDYSVLPKYKKDDNLIQFQKINSISSKYSELFDTLQTLGYNYGLVLSDSSVEQLDNIPMLCIQLAQDVCVGVYLTPKGQKVRVCYGRLRNDRFMPQIVISGGYALSLFKIMDGMTNDVKIKDTVRYFSLLAQYISASELHNIVVSSMSKESFGAEIIMNIIQYILPKDCIIKLKRNSFERDNLFKINIFIKKQTERLSGINIELKPRSIGDIFDIAQLIRDNKTTINSLIDIAESNSCTFESY